MSSSLLAEALHYCRCPHCGERGEMLTSYDNQLGQHNFTVRMHHRQYRWAISNYEFHQLDHCAKYLSDPGVFKQMREMVMKAVHEIGDAAHPIGEVQAIGQDTNYRGAYHGFRRGPAAPAAPAKPLDEQIADLETQLAALKAKRPTPKVTAVVRRILTTK